MIRRAMKRRFDDSDMRYGTLVGKQDYAFRRRSTDEEVDISIAVKLETDDFDTRNWTLAVKIGTEDEIMRLMKETQADADTKATTGEARTYRRLGDERERKTGRKTLTKKTGRRS